tara:strand:+ start:181 stop:1245 length:1065 start_codon:yes stop_codon:yes gene_type:complete
MGGAARVAVELVKRLNAHGIDARCLFLYGGPGGLSTEIREQSSWLGLMSSKDVLLKGGRLLAFIKETQPDIIHHHDGVTWSHLMTRLGYHGVRYGHAHNDGPQTNAPARIRFANWVHRHTYQHLLAVSSSTAHAWENRGFAEARIEVLPNGVDSAKFYPAAVAEKSTARERWGIPSEAMVLLSVGRLHVGMKGTDDFLRVLAELSDDYYGLIAGAGPDEEMLRALAVDLGVAERVSFCGVVSPVLPCYHAADMLLVTSHFEPFGLMLVEAMACGLAIAAFATTGGVMEVLQKSAAVISLQRDPAHLADLIKAEFKSGDGDLKKRANLDLVKKDYSWDAATSALADSYARSLKDV